MIKRHFLITASTLILVFLLTGCVRTNVEFEFTDDEKVNISMLMAINTEMADSSGGGSVDVDGLLSNNEQTQEINRIGLKTKPYSEDGYSGIILSKEDIPIDSINETFKEISESMETIESNTGVDESYQNENNIDIHFENKNGTYIFDIPISNSVSGSENEDNNEMADMLMQAIKGSGGYMRYTVKLPVKAGSNNATKVSEDGKTLTWDLTDTKNTIAHFEFAPKNNFFKKYLPYIITGVIIVALALVLIIVLSLKSARKKRFLV